VAFTYLTVKSAKCLCLLPVVLVLRIRFCLYLWGQGPPMITPMLQEFLNVKIFHSTCLAWLWLIPDQTRFTAAIQQQRTSASLFQRILYCRVCFSVGLSLGLSYGLPASSQRNSLRPLDTDHIATSQGCYASNGYRGRP